MAKPAHSNYNKRSKPATMLGNGRDSFPPPNSNAFPSADNADADDDQPMFGEVPMDTKKYLKSIEVQIDGNQWSSEDELESFLFNVYEEVIGKELCLASDPDCSIVIEKLLHLSSSVHLRIFFDKLSGNFPHLLKHFCASHVVQTLIVLSAKVLDLEACNIADPESPKDLPRMTDLIVSMCEQLTSFWAELSSDKYASFVVRILLKILMGQPLPLVALRSRSGRSWAQRHNHPSHDHTASTNQQATYQVPEACATVLKAIVHEILDTHWPLIASYAFDPIASPVIDQVLDAAPNVADLSSHLLTEFHSDDLEQHRAHMYRLMTHRVASRLVEKALSCCSSVTILDFYKAHVREKVADLCRHPIANHTIQALISNTHNAGQLEIVLENILPLMDTLLFSGRPLIVVRCVEAAQKYGVSGKVLKSVYSACRTKSACDLFPTLLFLNRNFPVPTELTSWTCAGQNNGPTHRKIEINRAGHQLVSLIFNMPASDNKELVDSFLARSMDWYHPLLLDPIASYTMQTFLTSKTIGLPPKRKLIFSFLNSASSPVTLCSLAVDKFGSHLIDAFWAVADMNLKTKLAQQLVAHEKKITDSHFGRFVWRNCNMAAFKSKREAWTANQKGAQTRLKLFDEMLGCDPLSENAARVEDEIDVLFKQKHSKGPKSDERVEYVAPSSGTKPVKDLGLQVVMGAIESTKKKRKRRNSKLKERRQKIRSGKAGLNLPPELD